MKKLTIGLITVLILGGLSFGYLFTMKNRQSQADSFSPGEYLQSDLSGGVSSESHQIGWGQADGWNKFASVSNITVTGPSDFTVNAVPAELVTSVFYVNDSSSFRSMGASTGGVYYSSAQYRVGTSQSALSDWMDYNTLIKECQSGKKAMQVKFTFSDSSYIGKAATGVYFKAYQGVFNRYGTVYDNTSKSPINGANVVLGDYSNVSHLEEGKGGSGGNANGYYSITLPYDSSTSSYSISVSKAGYQTQTSTFQDSCGASASKDFYLDSTSSSDNTSTDQTSNQTDNGTTSANESATSEDLATDQTSNQTDNGTTSANESATSEDLAKPSVSSTPATLKPASPTIYTINGKALSKEQILAKPVSEDTKIELKGKTIANATVKLYIFSDPIIATVKSDKDGNWSYTIPKLIAGSHTILAEVTDDKGNKSDKVVIAKFIVEAKSLSKESATNQLSKPVLYGLIGLWVVIIGVLVFFLIKKWKKNKLETKV